MDLKNTVILVWDDPANFNLPETKRQFGDGKLYKNVIQFQSKAAFKSALSELEDEDQIVVCCHVKYEDFSGLFDFKNSGIKEEFNINEVIFLSSGDSGTIMKKIFDAYKMPTKVILYNELMTQIKLDEIKSEKKWQLVSHTLTKQMDGNSDKNFYQYPKIDYAIITALFEDEFEEIQKLFDFSDSDIIKTEKKEYHVGYLKIDKSKKVVVAIPSATGMVDAAIIATQMLEFFRPKYLIMSGVCGGKKDMNFGDVVVAKSIFTFQKGKISNIFSKDETGKNITLKLFDAGGAEIDYTQLFDEKGNQISISIEKFEVEHDSIIELNSLIKGRIERKKNAINLAINEDLKSFGKSINIVIEPMACSTMVVNKDGYFEDSIKTIDRKTAAVEMESYGVARACQFANNGKTVSIIFKSVMDNMTQKDDTAKRFAAHTSAQFLKYLFVEEVLD